MGLTSGRRGGDFFNIFLSAIYLTELVPEATANGAVGSVVNVIVHNTKEKKPFTFHFVDHSDIQRCPVFVLFLMLHLQACNSLLYIIAAQVRLRTATWRQGMTKQDLSDAGINSWWTMRLFNTLRDSASVSTWGTRYGVAPPCGAAFGTGFLLFFTAYKLVAS
jgi:hypothetical protein